MSNNELSNYYHKGFDFLFRSPLYTAYNINTELVSKTEEEILREATEDNPPDIVYHDYFHESADFTFIKLIMTTKIDLIEYCPICAKEQIIYLLGKEVKEDLKTSIVDTYSYAWASEECETAFDFAEEKWKERLSDFIKNNVDHNGNITIDAVCKKGHKLFSIFNISEDYILTKVGQFPSRVEFDSYIKDYRKVLSKLDNKELNTAIGLASHGIGSGAYVYLRRVFERVIFDTFNREFPEGSEVTLEEFTLKKMDEKVKLLNIHFDDSINKKLLYDILSKGIHELSDEECREYFNIVLSALLIILEKQLEKIDKDKRQVEISKLLGQVHGKLKSK